MAALWITPFMCVSAYVCACGCWHAHVHTLHSSCFYFCDDFFSVFVRVCLHVLVVTTSSAVPPSLCDRQIARLLCSLLLGGCHQTLLVQPVILPVCVLVCVWETEFALCCAFTSSRVLMHTPECFFFCLCVNECFCLCVWAYVHRWVCVWFVYLCHNEREKRRWGLTIHCLTDW